MPTQFKIAITKEIIAHCKNCDAGNETRIENNCAIAFALADIFVNFRIKSARMYLKFENVGDAVFGKGYYLTPHYPMQGMTVQFGVSWRFFDQ